jgi:hypothetical protein
MRRSILTPVDGKQFPLTLAGGLRAMFAEVGSEPLPDEFTTLLSRLGANHSWAKRIQSDEY